MRKFFKGEKINAWEVIDPTRYYRKQPNGKKVPMILCYSEPMNVFKYVNVYYLTSGISKGYGLGSNRGDHSTRYKFKSLPKYVYLYQNISSKKVFRVCKKVKGTNDVKTLGYFRSLKEAKEVAKELN